MPKKKSRPTKPAKKASRKKLLSKKKSVAKSPASRKARKSVPAKATRAMLLSTAEQGCKPLPEAVMLVVSCHGQGPEIPLSTKLGTLFPLQERRDQFCQCVANGVPTLRSNIPCGAGNTLQDVVDAITC